MIFIIKDYQTIVFIFIIISTMFWPICPLAFFRCFLSKFLRGSFMIFIIKSFWTIVFILTVIFTMLPFLGVFITGSEQGFRSSVYYRATFTRQYLYFNSNHPYNVKKGTVCCLQHQAKAIRSNTDAYQEEMFSLRHNLHRNNFIISAPRNIDRRIKDDT